MRILQQILLEVRQTRQYVQFVHQHISEFEGSVPSPDTVRARARVASANKTAVPAPLTDEMQRILEHRRSLGLGEELTEEEKSAFARGETPESFRDPMV
jgi:hypothetical protein